MTVILPSSTWNLGPRDSHVRGEREALISELARELHERWGRGDPARVEELLDRHPELKADADASLRLIFEELCLRQEGGEANVSSELLDRFPQWHAHLAPLLEAQRLLETERGTPNVGETVAGFRLLAELGRGGQGHVFLATQADLANRPVVLKFTSCSGGEHLNLARLQHTHIVPLYAVHEDRARDRRILCMPYLGGASLAHLFRALEAIPPERRTGRDLLAALSRLQASSPIPVTVRGKVHDWLATARWEEFVCWLGANLAEALQYAHERGLVHLDLSAGNVLVAADGQPMLLDFHLSREPLRPGGPGPHWLGGTPGYMAPEHQRAFATLRTGRPPEDAVDERADVYSLGVVLYQALAGSLPPEQGPVPPIRRHNRQVSVGLSDVLSRCLQPDPGRRYPSATALAEDLRRHLAGQPLRGVPNRSLRERWRRWRRRRPYALVITLALVALVTAGLFVLGQWQTQLGEARAALVRGGELLALGQPGPAGELLERGQKLAQANPLAGGLAEDISGLLQQARDAQALREREQAAARLHVVVEQLRFRAVGATLPPGQLDKLEASCAQLWNASQSLRADNLTALPQPLRQRLQADLLDLAIIHADLLVRRHPEVEAKRHQALAVLVQARSACGASPALLWEERRHRATPAAAPGDPPPRTAWEHLLLGRSLLWQGDRRAARAALARATTLDPALFWGHFYLGVACQQDDASREAVQAFSVCIALKPTAAGCWYNRALSLTSLGEVAAALEDYTRALEREPALAEAAYNRGLLLARSGRHLEALSDLETALNRGADPALVQPVLAQVRAALQSEQPAPEKRVKPP